MISKVKIQDCLCKNPRTKTPENQRQLNAKSEVQPAMLSALTNIHVHDGSCWKGAMDLPRTMLPRALSEMLAEILSKKVLQQP